MLLIKTWRCELQGCKASITPQMRGMQGIPITCKVGTTHSAIPGRVEGCIITFHSFLLGEGTQYSNVVYSCICVLTLILAFPVMI